MTSTPIFEAVPNVSEGRRGDVLEALAEAVGPGHLLDLHPDTIHNRAVISLAGAADSVEDRLLGLVAESIRRIDLRRHQGLHPRVGVADVVPVIPLADATMEDAAGLARRLGGRVHGELGVPVYFYGAAIGGPTLAAIRAGRAKPDLGTDHHPSAGAVCVGARPPLVAYNVLLACTAEQGSALARGIRATAERGMPGVQALAFPLAGGLVQLSMNLVDLVLAPPGRVLTEVRRRAAEAGFEAGGDEVVGLCPAAIAPPSARGRLLECRLAAAAGRLGAERLRRYGGAENERTAGRLEAVARDLDPLGPGSDGLVLALERAADLEAALPAGAGLGPEADALLRHAALQLRGALPAHALLEYRERVASIDAWLHELR